MTTETVYTVSQLNGAARLLLEDCFPFVWVEGEISNFAAPHSGHWYFCLKDAAAQVRCAFFRGNQRKIGFTPKNGDHILLKARVSLYEGRGEFQLIGEEMEERGAGKLRQAFEALKKKLEAAGLFNAEHKKPLPPYPTCIGVVTSATGAAIRDILTVLKRRYPIASVIIYPTLVQGDKAAAEIVAAIQVANARKECDVLIVARGGGSIEDLWPFNEEAVAQAIYQSALPIISGVGHEIDFTIADFVADIRAPTPSAAAEIATPDITTLGQLVSRQQQHLERCMQRRFGDLSQRWQYLEKRLAQQHPKRRLETQMQRLDHDELKLKQSLLSLLHQRQLKLANLSAKLDTLSPLATLKRGYAIAMLSDRRIVTKTAHVKVGSAIEVQVSDGHLACVVEEIHEH